jgi:hypothetical protein
MEEERSGRGGTWGARSPAGTVWSGSCGAAGERQGNMHPSRQALLRAGTPAVRT